MPDLSSIDLSSLLYEDQPFPYFCSTCVFGNYLDLKLFAWFEKTNNWNLTETEFYEQYEFSFLDIEIPAELHGIISSKTISTIQEKFKYLFNVEKLDLVGITAHKLTDGQHIGIHNDFIGAQETHRLVVHINPYWKDENGGLFVLFNSEKATDITRIIKPANNSAIGFEISKRSNHAVSTIYNISRYSIVYTFAKTEK